VRLEEITQTKMPVHGKNLLRTLFVIILFFVLGFLIYSNTFQSPFVFDDEYNILNNSYIHLDQISINSISSVSKGHSGNRLIPMISIALNYYFGKVDVWGYHLVNILIHVLNGILLFYLFRISLSIDSPFSGFQCSSEPVSYHTVALLAALLWLTNPVQTQSVTYIIQRANSLVAMFSILSLIMYAKGRTVDRQMKGSLTGQREYIVKTSLFWKRVLWFSGCGLSGILAMASKESAAMLPMTIFIFEWYFFRNTETAWLKRQIRWLCFLLIPSLFVVVLALGSNPLSRLIAAYDLFDFTLTQRILTEFRVVVYYVTLLFYPHPGRLNLDYDFPLSNSLIDPATTIISLLIIIGAIVTAILIRKKERLISFAILWYFINLAIESTIIPLDIIFEHRVYLPSMFLFLALTLFLYRHVRLKRVITIGLSGILILFSVWTFQRNEIWKDHLTLWSDVVSKSGSKARPLNNLGNVYLKNGDYEKALPLLTKAMTIKPDHIAHYNMGMLLDLKGQLNQAIGYYSMSLQIKPQFAKAHSRLGKIAATQNKTAVAIKHYSEALKIEPSSLNDHINLGNILAQNNQIKEAIHHYQQALEIDPEYALAYFNLGNAMMVQKNYNKGVHYFKQAVRLVPGDENMQAALERAIRYQQTEIIPQEHSRKKKPGRQSDSQEPVRLGHLSMTQKNYSDAINFFNTALKPDPDNMEIIAFLGEAYMYAGELDRSMSLFMKVLQQYPSREKERNNLANMYLKQGKLNEAVQHYRLILKHNPDHALAHNNLGVALVRLGETEQGANSFRQALRIDPEFEGARVNLNNLLTNRK
jgi:protein O-mannosyl-transferase